MSIFEDINLNKNQYHNSSKLFIGIDNGLSGAVVAINDKAELVAWFDTPVIYMTKKKTGKVQKKGQFAATTMAVYLKSITELANRQKIPCLVTLETAQAMPKQGLSSTFLTGKGAGLWEGIVAGLQIPYSIVHPRTWTKALLKDIPLGEPKQRSMLQCHRKFPTLPLKKPKGKVLAMDGRADAALLALFGLKFGFVEEDEIDE